MGGGGIQSLGPTLQPRGGGSLAPPLQESVYSLVEEFSAMSLSTLGEEEIVDTTSVSSADQVTKWDSSVVATRHSHRATSSHAI